MKHKHAIDTHQEKCEDILVHGALDPVSVMQRVDDKRTLVMTERNHVFSPSEIIGKTIKKVEEGYEDARIVCEDGTVYSINTYHGDPRDI